MYSTHDVTAVFTNCLFPEFTRKALSTVLGVHPDLEAIVVDDNCREREEEMQSLEADFDITLLRNNKRVGTGRSLDRAFEATGRPLILTVDHGIELLSGDLLERYLTVISEGCCHSTIGVGIKRANNALARVLGPFVDPLFALWRREPIVENDLTFALSEIELEEDGAVLPHGTTAQFLCYRAIALGYRLRFVEIGLMRRCLVHHKTPRGRGKNPSPFDTFTVKRSELSPLRRHYAGMD